MTQVSFQLPDDYAQEAQQTAEEMGLTVGEIALSAFQAYLDGVRVARTTDADEN